MDSHVKLMRLKNLKKDLFIIEDCAEALGAKYKGLVY